MKRILVLSLLATLVSATGAYAQSRALILNEWNCVGDTKQLGNGSGSDTTFGTVNGNGGNWIELVVVQDHLDIRGWTMPWSNGDPSSGSVTFSDDDLWEDLRSGTIITIREFNPTPGTTDVSFSPSTGDWHIAIALDNDQYVSHSGAWKVDNDNWQMSIMNGGTTIQNAVGEAVSGWAGGGIASTEVGKLEVNPSASVVIGNYDDGDNSTFGQPNTWGGGSQSFATLRTATTP
jgi:hypothetical protein